MAPTFLNSLRRRSRASFRTNRSTTDTSSDGAASQGESPSSGSLTPPSIDIQSDPALHLQVKDQQLQRRQSQISHSQSQQQIVQRPPLTSGSNRNSVSGMSGLGAPSINGRQALPSSPYAPRLVNITENAWVYQKVLLVYGTIGNPAEHALDGTLNVCRLDDNFPAISWPVCNSHFKALVYLQPGPNKLRFEFSSPKLPNSNSSNPIHASYLTVHMLPVNNSPPLQLAILVAKDSPETFDASPARATFLSRPSRYSMSSLTSPPGFFNRAVRSGSQLASPQSGIRQARFGFDDTTTQMPSRSVPTTRRNSDDEKEEAVRQDPSSHRSGNSVID
jgi:hypothetical protein